MPNLSATCRVTFEDQSLAGERVSDCGFLVHHQEQFVRRCKTRIFLKSMMGSFARNVNVGLGVSVGVRYELSVIQCMRAPFA